MVTTFHHSASHLRPQAEFYNQLMIMFAFGLIVSLVYHYPLKVSVLGPGITEVSLFYSRSL